jgi:hypothetical protein
MDTAVSVLRPKRKLEDNIKMDLWEMERIRYGWS